PLCRASPPESSWPPDHLISPHAGVRVRAHPHPSPPVSIWREMRSACHLRSARVCAYPSITMRSIALRSPDSSTKELPNAPAIDELPLTNAGPASNESIGNPTPSRGGKFLSYYKPYMGLFLADMACALVVSAVLL